MNKSRSLGLYKIQIDLHIEHMTRDKILIENQIAIPGDARVNEEELEFKKH